MTKLIPVTKWNNHHEWPTEAGLRYYIFNAEFNGFNKVMKRVGRRILIDETKFFDWVEEKNGGEV
jgi:hypothetical protein